MSHTYVSQKNSMLGDSSQNLVFKEHGIYKVYSAQTLPEWNHVSTTHTDRWGMQACWPQGRRRWPPIQHSRCWSQPSSHFWKKDLLCL